MNELAGLARVAFETQGLTEFRHDTDVAERSYRDATSGMSDGAIKLELAQERLRRSLAKGPAAAQSQARALLSVRSAERELAAETARTTAVTETQTRRFGRLRSSAATLAGTTGFGGLRTSVAGLAGGLLAGGGLIYGLRSVISAAEESQTVLGQTRLAVERAGKSWDRYSDQIDGTIAAQSRLGFDDEELSKTFSTFVIRTRNVTEALRLNALATDVARARYLDLKSAADIVLKASLGQAGALRRIGIDARNGASGVELLTQLTQSYGGAAQRASKDASTATQRLNVSIGNLKETLGTGALPLVSRFAAVLAQAADSANELGTNLREVYNLKTPSAGFESGFNLLASLGRIPGAENLPSVGPLLQAARRAQDARREAERRNRMPDVAGQARAFKRATQPGLGGFIARARDQNTPTKPGRPPAFGEPGFKPLPPRVVSTSLPRGMADALLRAQITPTPQDDLRRAKEAEAYWSGQLDLARKGTEAHSTILAQLVAAHQAVEGLEQQLSGEQVRHDTVVDTTRRAATERHAKALERRKTFEKAAADREARTQDAIAKQAHENANRINKALKDAKTGRELLDEGRSKTKTAGDGAMTRDELGSVLRDFLTGFGAMIDNYYGNVGGPGSHSSAMVEHLLREQTGVIRDAFGRPHVGYTRPLDEVALG